MDDNECDIEEEAANVVDTAFDGACASGGGAEHPDGGCVPTEATIQAAAVYKPQLVEAKKMLDSIGGALLSSPRVLPLFEELRLLV
eukprot:11135007-Lingulodinium_polyedra.AAC.1